ncbi:hypothetical protein J8273_6820 [Carpediemonas membranifera]|uniref:Uncharacterized protein n=1 Tax=Carpediemonas membranifera TaxID=201153 RepID=A0A8J6ATC6_9EUKA|nr:hypothetical protein J8273_8549 [Carpediemonas membranifera]KAG9390686.1 hypothetical protein J8273_6923 [Carpediemonas membranifera]KAG9391895.1 hypothetical protein J8273_6820 [Carpediemonas membranifera]|eukprot:KAG9389866.1 hypothetical protein J8273_8549 [Carpediemonas membranifera]
MDGFNASESTLHELEHSFQENNVRVIRAWIAYQLCLYDCLSSQKIKYNENVAPSDALLSVALQQQRIFVQANKQGALSTRLNITKTPFYNNVVERLKLMGETESMMSKFHNIIGVIIIHFADFTSLLKNRMIPKDNDTVRGLSTLIVHSHLCMVYSTAKDIRPEIYNALTTSSTFPPDLMAFARMAFGLGQTAAVTHESPEKQKHADNTIEDDSEIETSGKRVRTE